MFSYGYCSHCALMVRVDALPTHQVAVHPDQVVYVTLYKPDARQVEKNISLAEELTRIQDADDEPSSWFEPVAAPPADPPSALV